MDPSPSRASVMTLGSITSRGRAPLRRDRLPGDGPTDPAGRPKNDTNSFARFEFSYNKEIAQKPDNQFFSGHFDAKCPWRLDDPALANDVFDPDVGFARVHYVMGDTTDGNAQLKAGKGHETSTASLFKTPSVVLKKNLDNNDASNNDLSQPLDDLQSPQRYVQPIVEYPYDPATALERHLVSDNGVTGSNETRLREDPVFNYVRTKQCTLDDVVDLEAFARYVYELKPKCQHDVAPMLYLTQALLGHILNREMSFFSAEVRELKNSLLRTKSVLEESISENKSQKVEAVLEKWRQAAVRAAADIKGASMEDHETYLLKLADEKQLVVDELTEELEKANAKLDGLNALREDAKKAKRETEKMKKAVALIDKKQADKEKTFKNLSGQKDRQILELKKKVAELSAVDDSTAKINELVTQNAELKRRLDEGEGLTVDNGEYEQYADAIKAFGGPSSGSAPSTPKRHGAGGAGTATSSDSLSILQQRAQLLKKLTPPEAARVCQAMGDWAFAGDVLRGTTIDYTSEVLTCGVLDHSDVGQILTHLSDMDGIVLFAMLRKTDNTNVTGPMKTVHPAQAAGWIVNAAAQAKKRLAIGESLGADKLLELMRQVGDDDAVLVLDSQGPKTLAKVFEKMYYDDELGDAVQLLTRCTGATRINALFAMDPMTRTEFSEEMNKNEFNDGEVGDDYDDVEDDVVAIDREAMPESNQEVNIDIQPTLTSKHPSGKLDQQLFQKARHERDIRDDERTVEHMTIPRAWLEYCECFETSGDDKGNDKGSNSKTQKEFIPKKMLKLWRGESYRVMRPIELRSTLTRIYKMKLNSDADAHSKQQHRIPLPDYVVHWFDNNYLFKKVARSKLAVFIFSLQRIYEQKTDKRACQFVRLCGLFHPMPSVMGDLLLEAMEITASEMSGPGELFFAPEDFWNTWTSGKMIGVSKGKQIEILNSVFAEGETFELYLKGTKKGNSDTNGNPSCTTVDLINRLHNELEEYPEQVPEYVTLANGSVSLSKFIEYVLELAVETNVDSHDAVLKQFIKEAGDDKILDFSEFKLACAAMNPITKPTDNSLAFMYWRALRWTAGVNKGAGASEVIHATRNSEDALCEVLKEAVAEVDGTSDDTPDGTQITKATPKRFPSSHNLLIASQSSIDKDLTKLGVEAHAGAESFLWHCGIINQLGVRADGSSVLAEARTKLDASLALFSGSSKSFVIDRVVAKDVGLAKALQDKEGE